ncbi:hypothetical protein BS17DRAFT_779703 [Gyrodon lividus]|nr:hypothetical protein BS17DRAFT_779703 [Gyrodon lividus]
MMLFLAPIPLCSAWDSQCPLLCWVAAEAVLILVGSATQGHQTAATLPSSTWVAAAKSYKLAFVGGIVYAIVLHQHNLCRVGALLTCMDT